MADEKEIQNETDQAQEELDCGGACSSCGVEGCSSRTEDPMAKLAPNSRSSIKKTIAVVSGKGGVGKSLVTSLLAVELAKSGKKVGILDADITGPSIPRSFGAKVPVTADEDGINPVITPSDIKIMSTNLMLPKEDIPVAWRGPVITGVIRQFWEEVNWGDIDIMLIDMPPGTSDVFLTIMQMLPVDGIVTVSAPQELVGMIVGKAANLANNMDVDIIGLVENMAYFKCDECGKEHRIFGESQLETVAQKYDIEATAQLPINPDFSKLVDEGKVSSIDVDGALAPILDAIEKA